MSAISFKLSDHFEKKLKKGVVKEFFKIFCMFAPTVHATLPIRTASQGVSFYLPPPRSIILTRITTGSWHEAF